MTRGTLPRNPSRSYDLLVAMLAGPGTYYQICERANFDIDVAKLDFSLRKIFDGLVQGNVRLVGIIYSLTPSARAQLDGAAPAYVGQVAQPRQLPACLPVHIVRAPARERRA